MWKMPVCFPTSTHPRRRLRTNVKRGALHQHSTWYKKPVRSGQGPFVSWDTNSTNQEGRFVCIVSRKNHSSSTSKKIALSIGNAIINRSEHILNQGNWHASFFVD